MEKVNHLIKWSVSGVPVLYVFTNPHMRNVVTPDLLLTITGTWVVEVYRTKQKVLDIALCPMLKKLGGAFESCLFRNVVKTVDALSMSNLYANL